MLAQLDLQSLLVLDIETVPQYPNFHELPENLQLLWDKKTQYQRKQDESPAEFYPRAGIWAEFGKIICISVGVFKSDTQLRVKSFCCDDEVEILKDFINLLNNQPSNLILCAHNGKEFDFPYLCRRMLINGLSIPAQLQIAGKKPWEINHLDTLELWKFGDYKNYTSLALLAAIFDIPTPKDDIDGSMVGDVYWNEKNLERISTYCQKDVITTARLIQKFKGIEMVKDEHITIVV
ncbi:3'-5' exonuclease [Pedobacter puniceum]|jgi:DNA polymerase elongation subunit (family B)|uniref:3'-5' exonuclease n=1 Tax=Pedobacter puniceum TaxID=2666136 RepID=A0A7K0FS45_9SPHI|nr:3'-5' exonuclease [Pedobacter puniceum]MRX48461.1 3'-5' exonuclease [Pedobacter puniceum]